MTQSVQLSRLNKQRLSQLKYLHVPWITVDTANYRSSPRFGDKSGAPRLSVRAIKSNLSSNALSKHRYFDESKISFTDPEFSMVADAGADPLQGTARGARRKPSHLQLLQAEQLSHAPPPRAVQAKRDTPHLALSGSVMSIHALTEEDLREEDDRPEAGHERSEAFSASPMDSGPVTIDDLRASVWSWCRERGAGVGRRVREFPGDMCGPEVLPRPSQGERRKNAIIQSYSRTEEEMAELRERTKNRGPITPEEIDVRDKVRGCYSAYMCQRYLDAKHWSMPEFIDNVDFTDVKQQRKAEIKAWKDARKAQPSEPSRSSI
jgi:hypothetical protein